MGYRRAVPRHAFLVARTTHAPCSRKLRNKRRRPVLMEGKQTDAECLLTTIKPGATANLSTLESLTLDPPHGQQRPASTEGCHNLQMVCKKKLDYFCRSYHFLANTSKNPRTSRLRLIAASPLSTRAFLRSCGDGVRSGVALQTLAKATSPRGKGTIAPVLVGRRRKQRAALSSVTGKIAAASASNTWRPPPECSRPDAAVIRLGS